MVETKSRSQATIPAEPQLRNARLQLLCYKYLWDNLVADNFPSGQFFEFFSLDPHYILCEKIRETTTKSGFSAETLYDLLRCFRDTCCMLSPAHDKLLLRYELQKNNSLITEDEFAYDPEWLKVKSSVALCFGWENEERITHRWRSVGSAGFVVLLKHVQQTPTAKVQKARVPTLFSHVGFSFLDPWQFPEKNLQF